MKKSRFAAPVRNRSGIICFLQFFIAAGAAITAAVFAFHEQPILLDAVLVAMAAAGSGLLARHVQLEKSHRREPRKASVPETRGETRVKKANRAVDRGRPDEVRGSGGESRIVEAGRQGEPRSEESEMEAIIRRNLIEAERLALELAAPSRPVQTDRDADGGGSGSRRRKAGGVRRKKPRGTSG